MTDSASSKQTAAAPHSIRPAFSTLAIKEFRETFRDRRTLLTLILMPLLVYPLLSLGFRSFLANSSLPDKQDNLIRYRIGLNTSLSEDELRTLFGIIEAATKRAQEVTVLNRSDADRVDLPSEPARRVEAPLSQHVWVESKGDRSQAIPLLEQGDIDLFVELRRSREGTEQIFHWQLTFDPAVPVSRNAARLVREALEISNRLSLQRRLAQRQQNFTAPMEIQQYVAELAPTSGKGPNITAIIPLILVLMTITGAVYPAIDLTAGERERGTLETLMAAPIPRMRILVAKMISVLSVSVLTAALNLTGMIATIWAFRLEATLIGPEGFSLAMLLKVFALLVLFAMFFSAVMLVITSYARSFKEAQAYLIPLILLSFGPGLLTLTPGMTLSGGWAVAPMVNILLLARDVLQDQVTLVPATVAIVSTAIYGFAAVALAASIFGSDSILYGGQSSWSDLLLRPAVSQSKLPPQSALFCLFMLFPLNFILIGVLSRIETSMGTRLVWMAAFTMLAFFLIPLAVALHQRVRLSTGFGWLPARPIFWVGALLLGLCLWPLVMTLLSGWQHLLAWLAGEEAARNWAERLVEFGRGHVERFREAPLFLIVIAFSLMPALCEEWFFRGLLLRSVSTSIRPTWAIVFSALAFGAFHTLSGGIAMFDRFLTTAALGLILGWLAVRSNSILPGCLLHATHNLLVFGLAYFQRQLSELPGFPGEREAVPLSWTLISALICSAVLVMISRARPQQPVNPPSASS